MDLTEIDELFKKNREFSLWCTIQEGNPKTTGTAENAVTIQPQT